MKKYTLKKPNRGVLLLLIVICVLLLILIVYIQGKTLDLQKMITRQTQSEEAEVKKTEEEKTDTLPYTATLRIVITSENANPYRQKVTVYGDRGMIVSTKKKEESYTANEKYTYSGEQQVRLSAPTGGQLYLVNDVKTNGYEGVLELQNCEEGIAVINEINMEAYLKRVIPSEMPCSYGAEALKAQAVCARTYAYAHSNSYAYPTLKGQMDDTVSFQVYNNGQETEETNRAVEQTAGEILKSENQVLDAMYYSTSCGYSQDGSLFGENLGTDVFPCIYLGVKEPKETFEQYICHEDENALESQESYFRWTAVLTGEELEPMCALLRQQLQETDAIECSDKVKRNLSNIKKTRKTFTVLKKIQVTERNPGGAATKIKLCFDGGTVFVKDQLHIRQILASIISSLTLQDGRTMDGISALPSAAFCVKKEKNGSFILYGGGFGHGVGMSQNGAKTLGKMGYSYRDILFYFYNNVEIVSI